jgi:hypothetical protein
VFDIQSPVCLHVAKAYTESDVFALGFAIKLPAPIVLWTAALTARWRAIRWAV